jgi:uncharacterized protein YukE
MAAKIAFDLGRATELKSRMNNCIGEVNGELDNMATRVAGITEWWKGGDEQGFIDNFNSTKREIQRALNECAEEYARLIAEISSIKQESVRSIKTQLRGG